MTAEAVKLLPWLRSELGWQYPEFAGALSGGNSNLTWMFRDGDRSCVVRTFPSATISPTAHRGIERERRVLSAIEGRVRAPRVLGWCEDPQFIGRAFLVLEYIDGVAITDSLPEAYAGDSSAVDKLGRDMMEALAAVHEVPLEACGLHDLGRPENFLERQTRRWLKVRADEAARELPLLESLGKWLLDREPPATRPCLIHGDFHLDNTLASRDRAEILAVIDWELATVGDPYTDLALALMLWGTQRSAEPPAFSHLQAISRRPGVSSRRDLAAHWSLSTQLPLDHLDYYMTFAFWRLAAIVEGAYCLYAQGRVDSAYARSLEYNVPALLREAEHAAAGDW